MWHSSLRESLPALQPANCFHAGVQRNTQVCLGRHPTHQLMHFFLLMSKVNSVCMKVQDCQACWLKQFTTMGEKFPPRTQRSSTYEAQLAEGGGRDNTTPSQVIAGKVCPICLQNIWEECCDAGPWKKLRVNGITLSYIYPSN